MSVSDKIGRVKKGERCIALDIDAKRCRRPAKVAVYYHGDGELYPYWEAQPTWVRAAFCEEHAR